MSEQIQHMQRLHLAGVLASGIAHDLNNQLTLVLGHLDLALGRLPESDPARESLDLATTAASHCAAMSQRLLRLGRKSGRIVGRIEVAGAVAESCRLLECIRPQNVRIRIDAEKGHFLHADATEFQQVLMNLAINAFQAMPAGGELHFRVCRTPEPGGSIHIAVRDNGNGIPVSLRKRIFEPFFTTRTEGGGSGLGLSTAKSIVEAMGGQMALDSFPGKGSTFLLVFPADEMIP